MRSNTHSNFPRPAARAALVLALVAILFPPLRASAAGSDPLRKSLVKIFTTLQDPNYADPWRMDAQEEVSGSGCILPGHRILTNAHVVSNQIFIQVTKDGDPQKYTAKRVAVAHDCDLAILKVDDPRFFRGTLPVTFGGLPSQKDKITVYGYPVGGDELSTTEGVVSRVEVIPYSHSLCNLLGLQTDAAINPGNSGGPVFKRGRFVGVAFQGYSASAAQATGYLVPVLLVKRFLTEIQKGPYKPVPVLGLYTETLENGALRSSFGMKKTQSGVLVAKVTYGSSAYGKIQENDVMMSIDGFPIANDGSIPFRPGERLSFPYPLCLHEGGDPMKFRILRAGKPMTVTVTLKDDVRLVPLLQYDVKPTYFIFDGLIFTPLNVNYMQLKKSAQSFMSLYFDGLPTAERKQVVVMSHILSHEINKGYGAEYANLVVKTVNGHVITGMKDLIPAFQDPKDGRHVIEIDDGEGGGTRIALDAASSAKATQDILAQNSIPSDRSDDLK